MKYLKIIFYCFLCTSTILFSHEDIKESMLTQKPPNTRVYGSWYTKELEFSPNSLPQKITNSPRTINPADLQNLKEYIQDIQFSGVVYLSDEKGTYKICSEKFETQEENELIFAIHSIGKVYTEILALIMIQKGLLAENALFAPLEMDSFSTEALPLSVQKQMRNTTLYNTMIHKGGFGDYLEKYILFIQKSLENQTPPTAIQKPEDFLPFSDTEIYNLEPDEIRYSNLGILLVGLSIQHHYQKVEPLDYNAILKKHILSKAEIECFFNSKPTHAHFNESDLVAPYICGSPAGGYWTSIRDLHKFGQWIRKKCTQEPDFMKLVEKYGQEFYSVKNREITHGGAIPSSSAFLSVFLDNGITIAIASEKANPKSSQLYNAIVRNVLSS